MTDDDLLDELLLRWEELHERGLDTSVEVLCADSPHLAGRLGGRIRALKVTAWMDDPVDADDEPSPSQSGPNGPQEPPRTLAGRYRLDEKIAEGGFSRVWKGYDPELRRAVAVKLPKRSGTVSAEGFLAEARRVASLRHPGVVPVFDVGLHDGSFFIVSEYVEGGSLADRIRRERLDHQGAVRLIVGIAETLAYAHEQGFIHRDIKPGNILLDHHGRALLADFGISSSPGEGGEAEGFGTLAYMSPERVGGESIDGRSDLYSLGVVLYEVLTGKLPHSATDPAALRRQILRNSPPEMAEIAEVSVRLAGVCRKCLSTDPSARHRNAAELAAELRGCLEPRSSGKMRGLLWAAPVLLTLAVAIVVGWQSRPIPAQEAVAAPVVPAPSWERVAVIGGRDVLHLPVGIVWDRDGNLVVANSGAGRLTVMERTGKVLRTLCQEGRLPHQILYPHYICLTSRGHLVVSDFGNHRIQVFDPDGNWIRSVGEKGKEPGRFNHPRGVACDRDDNLYVAEADNHRVQIFDPAGVALRQFGTPGYERGMFRSPSGLALDREGRIHVGDMGNGRAQVFEPDGQLVRTTVGPRFEAQGIDLLSDGRSVVADTFNRVIRVFDRDGVPAESMPNPAGDHFHPLGIAVGPDGSVAVTNYGRHEVWLYRLARE